jgi:hypothetical protein
MKRFLASSLALGILTFGGFAMAQDKPAAQPRPAARPAGGGNQGGTTTAAPRVRNYDFDADFIDGELVRPDGELLSARGKVEHGSLIKVRDNFIREIVKSAEDL